MPDSESVASALEDIALLLSFAREDAWKARAYRHGAELVRAIGDELGTRVTRGELTHVEGIGASLAREIGELWQTGRSPLLEKLEAEFPEGAAELARVPGMTLRRIQTVQRELRISSIHELEEACTARRLRELPGFGARTEQRLLEAITGLHAQPEARGALLLVDALAIAARIEVHVRQHGVAERVELAGAARRGEEIVNELALLFVTRDPDALFASLAALPIIVHLEPERGRARLTAGIGLRIEHAAPERAGIALVRATGPKTHVRAIEARASARGIALAEHAAGDEPALYAALGLHYLAPELRARFDAIDANAVDPFAELVSSADLRGAIHCHTTYSDGKDSIEAMARAAEALGMRYITITDHSPNAHYAGGVELERLKRQWDEIAEVQARVAIRILRGTESDILADGKLDYPDAVLEQFDVVIASIHGRLRMTSEQMTERLVRAMRQPFYKIWGHALGRLLLHREPFACDVRRVLDALASARGAIEINSDPHRLDLAPEWIPEACARGIPFVIAVDAHSTRGLAVHPFGVTMARRGGLARSDVLNTFDVETFLARVRPG